MSAHETAVLMADELRTYVGQVLGPWLVSNARSRREAEMVNALIPASEADVASYLMALPRDPEPFTPTKILKQIEAELEEALYP